MKLNKILFLILILFTSIFVSVIFANNEINVTYLDGMLSIKTRIAHYVLNAQQGVLSEVTLTMEDQKLIYRNDNDGFYTTLDASPIYPSEITVNGKEVTEFLNTTQAFAQDVIVSFNYGSFQKNVIIPFGPLYEINLEITGEIPANLELTFPRVGYVAEDNVKDDGRIMTSYYEKTKSLAIWKLDGQGSSHFKINGSKEANTVEVTYHGLHVSGYIGPAKKMTFINRAFPEDNVWISRVVNSYPGASSWYDPIFYLFVGLIDWLRNVTGNYGWAIILFTLIIRTLMYPLFHMQTKSMIDRKKLEEDPEYKKIMKIEDKQKKQEALMKFYKEKKVSLAGGCLPMLIQMPFFFLLFAVIRYESELFIYSPGFLIWQDLSVGGFLQNIPLVLISAVIGFFNSLITTSDSKMALQGVLMGALFPFLFIMLPTGLQLYWVTSTLYQFVVTYYAYKKNDIRGLSAKEFFSSLKKQS